MPPLTVACLQTRARPDFDAALQEALPLAEEAVSRGAQMLFLPEYCGGLATEGAAVAPPMAEEDAHPVLRAMRGFAAQNRVWVNLGSIAVTGPDGRIINRGFMLSPEGGIAGRYDKIHLFDVRLSESEVYRESDRVDPGTRVVIHDTPLARIGHTICYDLRFPHLFRALAQGGADMIACPAAFTARTGAAHWHVLNRARAIETTRFVVSAAMTGPVPGGGETYGHSLIVDPWGEVLADGDEGPGVILAALDLDMVAATEARVPSLMNDADFAPPDAADR
ncbi:carbon-nitrogen hydrolase family protein [Roseovarius spongiae]|uniref:Carbon-nitrogen hydrolase family protein n=1 Tax=Roseovarius spongiae TaxID=2320272 RepID=A0A3A8ASJ5_9RHOB|nr:carbon-nitrogen hydrolase family protein [Roseovarius spongiae]RKF14132.1 carbon-nitrogen hydrolase family protein [Roseovarius spongiae]